MLNPKPPKMTLEEYLAWEARQEEKHEFIDGYPVPRWPRSPGQSEAMAGASNRHNLIAANLLIALAGRLKGGARRPFGSDAKVILPSGRGRYPDVTVACGPFDPLAHFIAVPVAVFEVLSPSNTWFEQSERLADYQSPPSLRHIVFLAQDKARGQVWSRGEGAWRRDDLSGLDAVAALPGIAIDLGLAEIFDGVSFDV